MSRLRSMLATGIVAGLALLVPTSLATPAYAAADPVVIDAASAYIVANTDAADATGDIADAVIGLAAAGAAAADIAPLADLLETQTGAYVDTSIPGAAGPAAKLAIAAVVTGRDPAAFGGLDLVAAINGDLDAGGSYSGYEDVFIHSLVILGLHRIGTAVPQAAVDWLLGQQDAASGLFGYVAETFVADNDYSGLALQALVALSQDQPSVGVSAALDTLVPALAARKQAPGYYDGFSPVNSTAIVGPGMDEAGQDVADLTSWMSSKQLADGGFSNTLDGTSSDLKSAVQALLFLAGGSLVDSGIVAAPPVVVPTTSAPAPTTPAPTTAAPTTAAPTTVAPIAVDPPAQAAPGDQIAETGATTDGLAWGLAAVALGGTVLTLERRTRPSYARKH